MHDNGHCFPARSLTLNPLSWELLLEARHDIPTAPLYYRLMREAKLNQSGQGKRKNRSLCSPNLTQFPSCPPALSNCTDSSLQGKLKNVHCETHFKGSLPPKLLCDLRQAVFSHACLLWTVTPGVLCFQPCLNCPAFFPSHSLCCLLAFTWLE